MSGRIAVLVGTVACSSPSHPPLEDPTLEGGSRSFDAGIADVVEDTAGQCNDMAGVTQRTDVVLVGPGNAPSPSGGTPADGTFTMASYKIYANSANGGTGPSGAWFKEAIRLKGASLDLFDETDQSPLIRRTGRWSVDPAFPTSIHLQLDCPDVIDETFGFTAAAGSITFFFPGPNGAPAVALYPQTQ